MGVLSEQEERDLAEAIMDDIRNEKTVGRENTEVSEIKKEKWAELINATTREEKEFIASLLPVDICQNRISYELTKLTSMKNMLTSVLTNIVKDPNNAKRELNEIYGTGGLK